MILWYFFHKYFIQKKKHSLYAVCHCLTEKAMASPSEFGLAIEVTDGPKTLFCLKQKQTGLQKQKHTYFYLSFVCCMNVRCRVSMSSIFASTFASFMLKVKKKKKKKKSRPTDPPSEKWLVDNQTIYFFLA